MSNLLAVVIFGHEFEWAGPWSVSTTVLLLMLLQAVLVGLALIVLALLLIRKCIISRRSQHILVAQSASPAPRELVGISLDTAVVQREFTVGEPFNCDGIVVTARYSSEPVSETVTDFEVEKPPMYKPGKPTVTVKYGEFTAFYTISVAEAPVRNAVGISVDVANVQTKFKAGEPFNSEGLVVGITFDREPFYETAESFSVDAPDTQTAGEYDVVVHCGAFSDTYRIVVEEEHERKMIGIELDLSVVKTDFVIGEEFECGGLGVVACFDSDPKEEPVYDYTVDAPDLSKEGMANVVVHYGEFTQNYPVFVTEGRSLVGISLDTSVVRREFAVGEEFNSVGLIVLAEYDVAPMSEQVEDFVVSAPDMTTAGAKSVCVSYGDKTATYDVTVVQPVVAPAEESAEGVLRYDRSFTAKLIQSDDDTKQWYTIIKNELLSYKKVKARMSWKRETYRFSGNNVAKLGFRGNTLCLFLALDPAEYAEYADGRYKVEDVSVNKSFEDTPCMYRIKNDMRAKRACELIAIMMEKQGAQKFDREAEDYYLPYEGIYELVNKGLAKRMIVSVENFGGLSKQPADEAAATTTETPVEPAPVIKKTEKAITAPIIVSEESVEGGTLRYDRSFKAKVIQSDDEIQRYYSDIKNELLSYKKVHDRLSWKRETYKAAGQVVARLSYRGNTLCIYLPLNVADYEGTRYKVEDVSANKSCADTPCMFRIKNDKRLRLAADLIATVMQERGIEKQPRPAEDYTEPYQDIVKLIEQGLVRREIKSKEEESLFKKGE